VRKRFTINAHDFKDGYHSNPLNRKPTELSSPSVNCRISKDGQVSTRPGREATAVDLNESTAAMPYRMIRFPLTFYSVGTKVYYTIDGASTKYDTGVTQTSGTTTRAAEYLGDVYLINPTDGIKRILVTQLASAVTLGAATITTAIDGAVRVDTLTVSNLRINGTNEAYNAVNKGTGVFTLTGTSSQDYASGSYAIVTQSLSSIPKGSKLVFWKETMYVIGVTSNASYDVPTHTLFFGAFATSLTFENIFNFSGGLSGTELVGSNGKTTNIVSTQDNLYVFKEDSTYRIGIADVNITTGARPPQILSSRYGCVNEDSAVDMGGFMVWLTKDKRVMKSNVQVQDGQSLLYADETFDNPIRELLESLDDDQSNAHMWYFTTQKRLFIEVNLAGERITLVYNNDLQKWEPPDRNKSFKAYYQAGSDLYATDMDDDTIYRVEYDVSDNGADIECVAAGGINKLEEGRVTCDWQVLEVSGGLSEPCELAFEPKVNGSDGTVKTITSEGFSGATSSILIGDMLIGGESASNEYINFEKRLAIYPSKGGDFQWIFSSYGDNHRFRLDSIKIESIAYSKSLLTTV